VDSKSGIQTYERRLRVAIGEITRTFDEWNQHKTPTMEELVAAIVRADKLARKEPERG
jgi:hypothetical protein